MYSVVWGEVFEQQLAAVWLAARDRKAVSRAAAFVELQLARRPLGVGESRSSSVERVLFEPPIGIEYLVIEDDKKVIVQGVWLVE
jgi:hypothetical protein